MTAMVRTALPMLLVTAMVLPAGAAERCVLGEYFNATW